MVFLGTESGQRLIQRANCAFGLKEFNKLGTIVKRKNLRTVHVENPRKEDAGIRESLSGKNPRTVGLAKPVGSHLPSREHLLK